MAANMYERLAEAMATVVNTTEGAWSDRAENALLECGSTLDEFHAWFTRDDDDELVVARD